MIRLHATVRELQQRLSSYLDAVEAGAEVLVTDRGRPKARIIPVSDAGERSTCSRRIARSLGLVVLGS